MNKPARFLPIATAVSLLLLAAPSQAQFLGGILAAGGSIFTQATGGIGNKLMGGEQLVDLEAERTRFNETLARQMAGMDASSRAQLGGMLKKQWEMAETAYLMKNLQASRAKDASLVDFGRVFKDSMGAVSTQIGMASVFTGGSGVMDTVSSAALDGLVAGVSDTKPVNAAGIHLGMTPNAYGTPAGAMMMAKGAVGAAIGSGVSNSVSGMVSSLKTSGSDPSYKFPASADPLVFLGKAPDSLQARDLYRENGFIGWRLVDGSLEQGAQAYSAMGGDPVAKMAVYNFDKTSGSVVAAFRVLHATPMDFTKVVEGLEVHMNAKSRYASTGSALRAVWANGAFVTADESKVSVGWSALVPAIYSKAPSMDTQASPLFKQVAASQ